ncbi:hypothetical protein H2200_005376 [Cladophialophora chaetospira]|uniref:Major facilitator superfamily (MFS) profile domain-containing protein n=1 Tax=Cladophialophora chaetospira TaxID=386627 RepID=A0AA38XBZ2_9EURO|nr:hypothetical protein H2200_005376 [Cladophialophora chaetospira]
MAAKDSLEQEKIVPVEKLPADETTLPIAGADPTSRYSAFGKWQKRWIVLVSAFGAWFSTLTSFVFFPAITSLAHGLNTSIQNINLTVTSYLLVAGVAPAITATLSDKVGRRPAFLISFTLFLVANLGLVFQSSFPALFVLRMLQAAGIAGTFAIAYGVLADVTTPAERGSYVGIVAFCTNSAPSAGPVIAAALNASLGWRSIFVFLAVCSGTWLLVIAVSLPETLRAIVGDGSGAVGAWRSVPLRCMRPTASQANDATEETQTKNQSPLGGFIIVLCQKDKALVMSAIAVLYMVWNCLQASLSTIFIRTYHFNQLQAGLIYIPFGLGVGCAGFATGRILDRDYKHVARQHGFPVDRRRGDDLTEFPIEKARFRSTFIPLAAVCCVLIAYGWCLHFKVHFAVNLVLQLLLGMSLQVCFTTLNTLLMDLDPNRAATAQAVSNLFRCLLAAGALAILEILLDRIGPGATFSIVAATAAFCFPIFAIEVSRGQVWRRQRRVREIA